MNSFDIIVSHAHQLAGKHSSSVMGEMVECGGVSMNEFAISWPL